MSKMFKIANPPVDTPAPDESRPSARQLAPDFDSFNPAHYLLKLRTAQRQTALREDAQTALQDSASELRSGVKPSTWLVGLGAAFIGILDNAHLRSEFRPVLYGLGALFAFLVVALCLTVLMLTHVLPR